MNIISTSYGNDSCTLIQWANSPHGEYKKEAYDFNECSSGMCGL